MCKKILIITASIEKNVDNVVNFLDKKEYFRFDKDLFESFRITANVNKFDNFIFQLNDQIINSNEIKSIWYRRPEPPRFSEKMSQEGIDFAKNESRFFLKGLWPLVKNKKILWVNHPFILENLECNKLFQLQVAREVGLKIPCTLATNDFKKSLEFIREKKKVAIKAFAGAGLKDKTGQHAAVYTTIVNERDIKKHQDEIKYSPILFQEYIPKKIELRITVVGSKVFACAIDSQNSERTKYDWRKYDFDNVKHEKFKLPASIRNKILNFMFKLNLQFGTIDMVLTPDDEYVFLEVNPSGQWGWIEALTEVPINESIAKLLQKPEIAL